MQNRFVPFQFAITFLQNIWLSFRSDLSRFLIIYIQFKDVRNQRKTDAHGMRLVRFLGSWHASDFVTSRPFMIRLVWSAFDYNLFLYWRISLTAQGSGIEMARAANSPVFGPSATVLKQSDSNFFSDDVTPGHYGPLQSARQKFLFFAKFHNTTKNIFCCCSLHFTVLPTFRFTCFHANQWTMLGINQSNQHFHL